MAGRDMGDLFEALHGEVRSMRAQLAEFVKHQTAILEGEVSQILVGQIPAAGGGVTTDTFQAQTAQLEIITCVIVFLPVGTTLANLTLGEFVLPIQNTMTAMCPIRLKVTGQTRAITYTAPAGATIGSTILISGLAVPSAVPGRLH